MIEKLSNGDMDVFAFDFDSDATLLGYPRHAEHTERLHLHYSKVKNSSLPSSGIMFFAGNEFAVGRPACKPRDCEERCKEYTTAAMAIWWFGIFSTADPFNVHAITACLIEWYQIIAFFECSIICLRSTRCLIIG